MTTETICLTAGIIFVFSSIVGGGIESNDFKIPLLRFRVRIAVGLLGFVLCLPFFGALIRDTFLGFPHGTIVAWWSKAGNPPKGWLICNGDNGTPDLRNKFLQGVVTLNEEGVDPNGSATHTHTGKTLGDDGTNGFGLGHNDTTAYGVPTHAHWHILQIDPATNIPPNVKVVFIMKE